MPIDASIYQSVKPIPVDMPDPVKTAEQAMTLRQLGMQMQTQNAVRDAYAANTDPQTGQLNQQGFLAHLGKMAPYAVPQYQQQFAAMNKQQAEAKAAWADAAQKALTVTGPKMDYVDSLPEEQRPQAYREMLKAVAAQGGDTKEMLPDYEPGFWQQKMAEWQHSKPKLENMLAQEDILTKRAERAALPIKIQNDLYGSRSPNAELTSQYDKQAAPIRESQRYMAQMIDARNNPSPQSDAALVINAFKIHFPNAPDVNSLEEMSKSQAAPDRWKQIAAHALSGGIDQATRDNLLRDGISTYRANVNSLRGIQQRYLDRQKQQGVNDPTLTAEPAIDKTHQDAMSLYKDIGPYKPPAERGGILGTVYGAASKLFGNAKEPVANATAPEGAPSGQTKRSDTPKYRSSGSTVSSDEVAQYAVKHKMKLSDAQSYLKGLGYVIGR